MRLEELRIYNLAMEIAEEVWGIVNKWDYFAKDTIGKQLVKSIDSIAANISEGFGRFHFKEAKNFTYYSRGSLFESKTWLEKAHKRDLINDEDFNRIISSLDSLGVKINNYINTIGNKK